MQCDIMIGSLLQHRQPSIINAASLPAVASSNITINLLPHYVSLRSATISTLTSLRSVMITCTITYRALARLLHVHTINHLPRSARFIINNTTITTIVVVPPPVVLPQPNHNSSKSATGGGTAVVSNDDMLLMMIMMPKAVSTTITTTII